MNRLSLALLIGAVAAAPVLAAKTPAKNARRALEDDAWSQSAKTAKTPGKAVRKTKPGSKSEPSRPTVTARPKPNVPKAAAAKPGDRKENSKNAVTTSTKIADPDAAPSLPGDLSQPSEMKAHESSVDTTQDKIADLLAKVNKKKRGERGKLGLAEIIAMQPELEKAMENPNIPQEERDSIRKLAGERDAALYMVGASLIAQKKDYAAAAYLRFVAKSAAPNSPMRAAARHELLTLGLGE